MTEYYGHEVYVRPGMSWLGMRIGDLEKQLESKYHGKSQLTIDHIHDDKCGKPDAENRKPFHRKEIIKIGYRIKLISQDENVINNIKKSII
jgi:hypothetical protein